MQPTLQIIRDSLGQLVFGEEDDELQDAVVRTLAARRQTLAIAEAGTGGLIASWLSDVRDADAVFLGALIDRTSTLPVIAAARRAREMFRADIGLAIGTFPVADSESTAPGTVRFAIDQASGHVAKAAPFAGHPDILKARAGKQALDLLRLHLLAQPVAAS